MIEVFAAFTRSLRDLSRGAVLWHALWPPLLALALWATLGFVYWSDAQALLARLLPQLPWTGWDWLARWAGVFLLLAVLAALTYITATMLVAIFALPLLIRLVAQRDYPELGRHGENVFWASLGNTLAAGAIFLVGSLAHAAPAADPRHAAGAAAALGGLAQPAHLPFRRPGRTCDRGGTEARRRRQPPRSLAGGSGHRRRGSPAAGQPAGAGLHRAGLRPSRAGGVAPPAPTGRDRTLSGIGALIIGDEIILGRRQDKHFARIVEILAARGLTLDWALYAGDDRERLTETLRRTLAGGDIVFSCGGIGNTPDDHTRQAAAAALGVALELHADAEREIRGRYAEVGREVTPFALDMGRFPAGSRIIPNPVNRIAGFSHGDHHFVPGFPQMAWPMIEWVLDTQYADRFNRNPSADAAILVWEGLESVLTPLMIRIEAEYPRAQGVQPALPWLGRAAAPHRTGRARCAGAGAGGDGADAARSRGAGLRLRHEGGAG
jgi:molybdopterin-biosynthesis enzyme MoeA-like protein